MHSIYSGITLRETTPLLKENKTKADLSGYGGKEIYKMKLCEALEMIQRGETTEEYKKRVARIRRLANERDDLEASLTVLTGPDDEPKASKKRARLKKVLEQREALK